MKRVVLLLTLLAACAGVSSHPQPTWDAAVTEFADAHCRWYFACGDYTESGCTMEVAGVLAMASLGPSDRAQCAQCLQDWATIYQAHTSPCSQTLTYDEQQELATACQTPDGVACVQDDLPGDGRFGP